MKIIMFGFLVLSVALPSAAAIAQTETLTYQGSPFTETDSTGAVIPGVNGAPPEYAAQLGESITGSVVLSAPLIANGTAAVSPVSFEFSVGGHLFAASDDFGPNASFTFTTTDGAITGFDFSTGYFAGGPGGYNAFVSGSGSSGDEYSVSLSDCAPAASGASCSTMGASATPGTWTVAPAPEMDATATGSALTLLLGGLAVLGGRNRRSPVPVTP